MQHSMQAENTMMTIHQHTLIRKYSMQAEDLLPPLIPISLVTLNTISTSRLGSAPVIYEGICNSGDSSTLISRQLYLGCWAHWGYISRSLHWPALTRRLLLIIVFPVFESSSNGGQSYKRSWNMEWIFCSSGTGGTEKSGHFTECWGVCILPYTFIRMNVQDMFVTCICDSCIKVAKGGWKR